MLLWYSCIIVMVGTLLYFINVGFELLDEGFYMQGYMREQPIFFNPSGFHFIIRWLPYSDDIIAARLYRIVLHLVCGVVLARALHKHVMPRKTTVELAAYTIMGNLLSYLFGPITISYNTLTLYFLQLLLAVYLDFRQQKPVASRSYLVQMTTFGILLGLLAFTKITSAALFALLFGLDQWMLRSKTLKERFATIMYTGVTTIICYATLIAYYFGKGYLYAIYFSFKPYNPFNAQHFSLKFLLTQLLVKPFTDGAWVFGFALIFFLIYLAYSYFNLGQWLMSLLMSISVLCLFYVSYKSYIEFFTGAEYIFALLLFVIAAFIFHQYKVRSHYVNKPKIEYLIMFLVFPIIGFFGSDNPPYLGLTHYALFSLILIIYLNHWLNIKFFKYQIPILLAGFILFNVLVNPYLNPPVWEQDNLVTIKDRKIWVSDKVKEKLEKFDEIKIYIDSGRPIIPVRVLNGLMYANNMPMFFSITYNNLKLIYGYLQLLLNYGFLGDVQILINKDEDNPYLHEAVGQLLKKIEESGHKWQVKKETSKYRLIVVNP